MARPRKGADPNAPKRPVGRPAFVPTKSQRDAVRMMRGARTPAIVIARTLGIADETLKHHFSVELRDGQEDIVARAALTVSKAALDDWRAAIAYLERFGGEDWKRTERRLHGGDPNGIPLAMNVRQMSDDELRAEVNEIRRRQGVAERARGLVSGVPNRSNGVGHGGAGGAG